MVFELQSYGPEPELGAYSKLLPPCDMLPRKLVTFSSASLTQCVTNKNKVFKTPAIPKLCFIEH